jgi:uncharacterized protein (UPF0261 family)/ABC-type branched-subunit amino acid transport system ATPase component
MEALSEDTMPERPRSSPAPVLQIRGLNVFYGHSHALQGVDLTLDHGVLSVVGRNGMGKTTLCKTIMGLVRASSGSVRFAGEELIGLNPAQVARLGVGYVPQGRRLWRSLTVDEHLRLTAGSRRRGAWTVERIYDTFPRLAERRQNGGGQLSGGEQQMLAISRALLLNPRLLVMDEPTEGLAPVIVAQVEDMLVRLGEEGDIAVLVIEQNIGVATAVSERVAIMVNGRVNRIIESAQLAADRALQQRLLGVGRHGHEDIDAEPVASAEPAPVAGETRPVRGPVRIYMANPTTPTRWSPDVPAAKIIAAARTSSGGHLSLVESAAPERAPVRPLAPGGAPVVLVAGTLDTKGEELRFIRDLIREAGLPVRLVDLSTSGRMSGADIPPLEVALHHRRGSSAVFTGDRGAAVAAMAEAFEAYVRRQGAIAGIISAGGSGGTSLATPAMRALPVGVPKVMVSTVASGEVGRYVGPADVTMMHAVTDVQGLNVVSRQVLANGARALIGMVQGRREGSPERAAPDLPAIGLTMFGVTTACVQQVTAALKGDFDCLVFHATGVGGQAMEKLVEGGQLLGVLDLTTTEICDHLMGGVFPATEDRLGAVIRARMPYVGSCGALDMVNFGPPDTLPSRYQGRRFYEHNPNVTLMRTTAEENVAIGRFIGERLNRMEAPVRFLLPEGGVSALDAPGQPFHDPAADAALFRTLEETVRQTSTRRLVRVPAHINDPAFAAAAVEHFRSLHGARRPGRRQARSA